ncbi:MAG TPA: hypothetical protein VFT95_05785 [Micromonosporaceae bacterium]|nr:hypothetical protein [Micromonosporaceae bacterium]
MDGGDHAIHVGEVLVQVADDGVAGLPVLCMAQAMQLLGGRFGDRFQMLQDHPSTTLVAGPQDWRALVALVGLVGRWDAATAAVLAIDLEAALLSADRGIYSALDPYLVIEV